MSDSYTILRGAKPLHYVPDGTYHGTWETVEEVPVGGRVEYDRCGDNYSEGFRMPEVGGTVSLHDASHRYGEEFRVGTAVFRREELRRWREELAFGDTTGSLMVYRRIS